MDIIKEYSYQDLQAACSTLYTTLYANIQKALLSIHSYNKGFYTQSWQNITNYVNSIPGSIWIWFALPLLFYIAMKIMVKIYLKLRKYSFSEFLSAKCSKKNPNHLNIFDLAKTSYRQDHTEAAIDLIERLHYDVNLVLPANGLTIFLCACLGGTKPLIQYMLLKGANVRSVTRDGDSALYLATYAVLNSRQPDIGIGILELLLAHGCNVNQQNHKGYTPLHRAASKGNMHIIKCLLRHGANLNISNKSGIYPIDSATNAGHPGVAEFLAFNVCNPHVWDIIDHHTPPKIKMGLQSPMRPRCLQSPHYMRQVKKENGHRKIAH